VSAPIPPVPPAPIEPAASGRGWGKKLLIGCGVVALVVAACLLALILYLRQRPEAVTDVVMNQVESHYAPDVTAREKQDLRAAYAGFRSALKEHRVSREPLDRMRSTLVVSGSQNEVSREQVRQLTELFRRSSGSPAEPGPPATPVPSPRPSP
jgi:hypothetical protein